MSWRDNWLLALPVAARLVPPLLLTVLGGVGLIWLHDHAPAGWYENLAPLVWCLVGAGLLVRPAQSLLVSTAGFGMAAFAAGQALGIATAVESDARHPADSMRVALWSLLTLLALPAAIREALAAGPVLARRLFFGAVAVFFIEQGLRHALGIEGRPSQSVFLFLMALVALFAVFVAERTLAAVGASGEEPPAPTSAQESGSFAPPRHPVHYLDEAPTRPVDG